MGKREKLIALLADGEVHSGAAIARTMHCSRTTVWKYLRQLKSLGLEIAAMPGRGYRLLRVIELLDRMLLLERMNPQVADSLEALEVFGVIESTSDHLRATAAPGSGRLRVVLAEYQTDGRGRRGRRWLSPYGSGLCLSVAWCFSLVPPALSALSLAAAVAVHRALAVFGPAELGLKWPNDIITGSRKVGGLLVDVEGESQGPIKVVIGVGINIDVSDGLDNDLANETGLPPAGFRELISSGDVSRNTVAANVINELHTVLVEFADTGFESFVDEWQRYDRLHGKLVAVQIGAQTHAGIASGIAPDGTLLLEVNGETMHVTSGEVSLRAQKLAGSRT
jgi:BirA family biotin operon repressor/biotin-[acetyl-CoA-carboxylase] ligase